MKVFLYGSTWKNEGPSNVNKKIAKASDDRLIYLRRKNKICKLLDTIQGMYKSDVIVISGICSQKYLRLFRLSRKKLVYLMHGDYRFENEVNNQGFSESNVSIQDDIFRHVSKIICVSEGYSEWVKRRYPEHREKITFINNGIDIIKRPKLPKEPYSLAVAGGNRPIKANKYVCKAVSLLRERGIPAELYVFGNHYESCEELPNENYIKFMGQMDIKEYYDRLDKIKTFVMNSDVESFGLTVGDALNCNCSMLLCKNIGACSILDCTDNDIVNDNHNPDEIAEKILLLEECPNADRLYDSVDFKETSIEAAYLRLIKICNELL